MIFGHVGVTQAISSRSSLPSCKVCDPRDDHGCCDCGWHWPACKALWVSSGIEKKCPDSLDHLLRSLTACHRSCAAASQGRLLYRSLLADRRVPSKMESPLDASFVNSLGRTLKLATPADLKSIWRQVGLTRKVDVAVDDASLAEIRGEDYRELLWNAVRSPT